MKSVCQLLFASLTLLAIVACERQPPLHLVERNVPIEFETPQVELDLDALWDYELVYEWRDEWSYGWDEEDERIFGSWAIQNPRAYHIMRYYTEFNPTAPHRSYLKDYVVGTRFAGRYQLGYYDILVWNDVATLDGVQSLHIDYESNLEQAIAYTNQANYHTMAPHHAPAYAQPYRPGYAFYQPEFLFAGDYDDLHVSDNPADYDYFDEESKTWHKHVPITLTPVTYIYLTQVVLHNNRNRIVGIDGSANITGMARSVNLRNHQTNEQDVSVNFPQRMKKHLTFASPNGRLDDDVDIVGGRVFTFGLTGTNPYLIGRSTALPQHIVDAQVKNFLEVNMVFQNGRDSTLVFDITSQVKERFKGGVITVELDVDTVPIPRRSGGSGFDAVVKDFDEELYEFEM